MATSTTPPMHGVPSNEETPTDTNALANAIQAQTETPEQAPVCPVCHSADRMRTIQAAFDLGVEPIAPPAMPSNNVRMAPWLVASFFLFVAGNFYLFVALAANANSN